jgi:hypothetical protein
LRISDSKISAIPLSGAIIGSAREGDVSHLILDGELVLNCDQDWDAAAIQSSESIGIVNVTITVTVRRSQRVGIPPSVSGSFSLAITYTGAPEEWSENLPFARFTSYIYLQVDNADLRMEASWAICVWCPPYSNCFELN